MAAYDRRAELKAFDATKSGVKGLVDAGTTQIPRIFLHTNIPTYPCTTTSTTNNNITIPTINLSSPSVVEEMKTACEKFGIFQLVGHGIDRKVLDEMLHGVKEFHEEDVEVKKVYYTRDMKRNVQYSSNFDLFQSPAANWRDTIIYFMKPDVREPEELPSACREITIQYANHMQRLGVILFKLLSEALGLDPDHLIQMGCAKGVYLACHYYPSCPEPLLYYRHHQAFRSGLSNHPSAGPHRWSPSVLRESVDRCPRYSWCFGCEHWRSSTANVQ